MKPDLKIDQDDLVVLFHYTKFAFKGITFEKWCKDCKKSYLEYFNNKELFMKEQYTYSQYVNAQIIDISMWV